MKFGTMKFGTVKFDTVEFDTMKFGEAETNVCSRYINHSLASIEKQIAMKKKTRPAL